MSSEQGFTQETRWLKLTSPLDPDKFLPLTLSGHEGVSELFEYTLELGSEVLSVDPKTIVGHSVTVELTPHAGGTGRFIHGHVRRFQAGNVRDGKRRYVMEIVPTLWFLSQTRDSCIYQGESQKVLDIVQEVLNRYGIVYDAKVQGESPPLNYCVQYQESAFAFVSRLMENSGVFYFFTHSQSEHRMILADSFSAFNDLEPAQLPMYGAGTGVNQKILVWQHAYEYHAGKFAHSDYEFRAFYSGTEPTPAKNLLAEETSKLGLRGQANLEIFEYPVGHQQPLADSGLGDLPANGQSAAAIHLAEEDAQYHTILAESTCRCVEVGKKFQLTGHSLDAENKQSYAILGCELEADATYQYERGETVDLDVRDVFVNRFKCCPLDVQYRPQRKTPKPRIYGTQTAVVVGGSDEEIHTDEHGRIQVQFFWDRISKRSEPGVCWVRCAQSIAGKMWGGIFIPRVGQEVVVTFLEGDPNRPLVTGVVYNGEQMPPYSLPDNKTKSGFKTMSTTKGDAATFNELRFEDKKDSEEVYFHAERDFNRVVENNDTLKVGFEKKTDGNQTIDIFNNQTMTIGDANASDGSQTLTVKKDRTITVKEGDHTRTVNEGNETLTIDKGNRTITVSKGNNELTVSTGDRTVNVDTGNDSLTVKSGDLTINVTAGTATIEAGQTIELKVGSNSITIENSGITISGTTVTVEGEASAEVTSPASTVNGDGSLTLSGGVVSLN